MIARFSVEKGRLLEYGTPVDFKQTPNVGREMTPRFVVMHYTAGYTARSAIETLRSPAAQASAHVVIDRDGEVTQLAAFDRVTWHAGPSRWRGWSRLNNNSIGIELVNIGFLRRVHGGFMDSYGSRKSAAAIGPVLDAACPRAGSGVFSWQLYTDEQLEAAEKLVEALEREYGLQELLTHEEIDTRGWKTDPGPAFPIDRFRGLVLSDDNDLHEVVPASLNLRTGPGVSFGAKGFLRRGETVSVSQVSGDWSLVNEAEGLWVHSSYLRALT